MNDVPAMAPTILVVLGATGDLMSRKIAPALFHLFAKDELPEQFHVVGVSRQELSTEAFREQISEILDTHRDITASKRLRKPFLESVSYAAGDFAEGQAYQRLGKQLAAIDEKWGVCSNKLFYLAVPPSLYEMIFRNLAESGLTEPCGGEEGWTRVIVEKPFGNDLKTAEALDALLGSLFAEEQIYRIDHYLGKEMIRNILAFRFANALFESNWGREHIAQIELSLLEEIDVGARGSFYDGVGALRDVGQNHLLQMLALLLMDHPGEMRDLPVRQARARVLEALACDPKQTFRAQYQSYRGTQGVHPDSLTETYFAIRASVTHERWQGVPILLEGGKAMGQTNKALTVTFAHPKNCLCPEDKHYENQVIFSLEPEEGIFIRFFAKQPGLSEALEERMFRFYYEEEGSERAQAEAYEKLLLDCIRGDQLLFVSTAEVSAMWQFIDPILAAWGEGVAPLQKYMKGTDSIREIARDAIK